MKKANTSTYATYEKRGEASSYMIRESKKGWVIENWSAYSGTVSGRKILLPYSESFPRGCNLSKDWNEFAEYGEMLYEYSKAVGEAPRSTGRVLRRGHIVQ